ncbi:hypothetical protein BHE74_00014254 [Ensete ventricosum]|nr:hypothetical protein BHE74_00014254 [Ensete ventricosum]RZS12262.1 hypothetical protein BHM03_00043684 [Ensete ventricosum]
MSCMFAIADSRSCSCASVWSHTTWFYPNGTLTSNPCILCAQANRDMTRMEIFLSLVQLLEPASESVSAPSSAAANINTAPTAFHQTKVTARVV